MKINSFWGELPDNSAEKEALRIALVTVLKAMGVESDQVQTSHFVVSKISIQSPGNQITKIDFMRSKYPKNMLINYKHKITGADAVIDCHPSKCQTTNSVHIELWQYTAVFPFSELNKTFFLDTLIQKILF